MKRFIVSALALCIVFSCTACGSGTNEEADYEKMILGKWYFPSSDGTVDTETYIVFYENGTAEELYHGRQDRKMYALWTIEGDKLILTDKDKNDYGTLRITSLSETELVGIDLTADNNSEKTVQLIRWQ